MNQFKVYTPTNYYDNNNNLIHSPLLSVSNYNVDIGDQIKKGDLLYNLELLSSLSDKNLNLLFPVYASIENVGYVKNILWNLGEHVEVGSAILVVQKEKATTVKEWSSKINRATLTNNQTYESDKIKFKNDWKNEINKSALYDWKLNDKLFDYADNFIKKLDDDFLQIQKSHQNQEQQLINNEISSFREFLGLHYNCFEKLYFSKQLEDLSINENYPRHLPLGHFDFSYKGNKYKLLNLIDFPIGNIALSANKVDDLPYLHDFIIQSVTSVLLNLKPNLIKVRGISFKDFGFSLTSLTNFSQKFFNKIVIDEQSFTDLCEELEARIVEVRKKCLTINDNLVDFNRENPDRAEPFYFVFCSIDNDFPVDLTERLLKFLNSESIGKAGIFFYVIGLKNKLIGSSYKLNISLDNKSILYLNSDIIDLSYTKNLKIKSSLLSKKLLSSVIDKINKKKDLIKLNPFIDEKKYWFKSNSFDGIRVPIGYAPDENIELIIGHNTTNYNALIGGGVGSGKSVLLHNIILGIATRYDASECQFLLLDYKEGTEFLPYQFLPHAHVLSTESDPVFGLKTLEYVNDEISKRGILFKKAGVSNISKFRSKSEIAMPRWVIIIDEFQRMFQDQTIMSKVETLFDDLNRRGRAFGIHFILATQSIYDLNMTPATLSQLSIRICLKISEMDASKILHVDNLIPSTFDKPGMCIYNNNIGLIDSNLQMQVPFIDGSKIKNLILEISKKNKIKTINYISKGQQFELFDKKNNSLSEMPFVSIGSLQNIEKTYFNLNVNPQTSSPILILGNHQQKLRQVFKSFVRDYFIKSKDIDITCLDFHPLNMDTVTNSLPNKDKVYKFQEDQNDFLINLKKMKLSFSKSKKINILLVLGLDESLTLKENVVDDIGSQSDNETKTILLSIIRERLSLNLFPIVFLRKLSGFSTVFDSLNYENSISSDIFTRRVYMDTPQEFHYEVGNLNNYKIFYQDLDKSSRHILTLFE